MTGPLLWLDVETTGLNPTTDFLLEIALAKSSFEHPFDVLPLYHAVVAGDWERLEMADVVRAMHTKSGLFEACKGPEAKGVKAIETELDALLGPLPDKYEDFPILAGSAVHFDLRFLRGSMPRIAARFHHRTYDVSSIKLFCESIGMPRIPKGEAHRATKDIDESVAHAYACARWLRGEPHR